MTVDFEPATTQLQKVVASIGDDQLGAPTPCEGLTVGDLLEHVRGFCNAFTAVARKDVDNIPSAAPPDGSKLPANWREEITQKSGELADAWSDSAAWSGSTKVAGNDIPAEMAGSIALDEVVLHAWDLAVATGQSYEPPKEAVAAIQPLVQNFSNPKGTPGLFGPPVEVPESAPQFHQVLGLAGRDPNWSSRA